MDPKNSIIQDSKYCAGECHPLLPLLLEDVKSLEVTLCQPYSTSLRLSSILPIKTISQLEGVVES